MREKYTNIHQISGHRKSKKGESYIDEMNTIVGLIHQAYPGAGD